MNNETRSEIRELSADEIDLAAGGFIKVESDGQLTAITVGGYGIWFGAGCVGILTPDRVLGACVR
jgi:hypothetical protein